MHASRTEKICEHTANPLSSAAIPFLFDHVVRVSYLLSSSSIESVVRDFLINVELHDIK